jgi:hypothetical protein
MLEDGTALCHRGDDTPVGRRWRVLARAPLCHPGPYVPKTLEAVIYFADEDNAFAYAESVR